MESVIEAIINGQPEEALIRLWVKAESTVMGDKQTSLWQARRSGQPPPSIELPDWLESPDIRDRQIVAQHPLELLAALDAYLHEMVRDSHHAIPRLEIDGHRYALIHRAFARNTSALTQTPNPGAWCRYHSIIPFELTIGSSRLDISVVPVDWLQRRGLPEIRCRLSHFDDQVLLLIDEDAHQQSFRATGLSDESRRRESLMSEVNLCANEAIHFWVAPELTVPPALQDEVGGQLAAINATDLLLCVPGSFHSQDRQGHWRNTTQVFNGNGSRLPKQHKLTQFSWRPAPGEATVHEGILASRQITVFLTPVGLVGVAICKDFSDASAVEIKAAWDLIAPDWMLVASYGDREKTLKRHREKASEHATLWGTRSLIANQEPFFSSSHGTTAKAPSDKAPGFLLAAQGEQAVAVGGSTLTTPNPVTGQAAALRAGLQRVK